MTENLLLTVLTAVLCENFVLNQLLGGESAMNCEERPTITILRGIVMTVLMTGASMLSFAAGTILFRESDYLIPLVFALLLAGFELAADALAAKVFIYYKQTTPKTHIFLNSAVFAVILKAADCSDRSEAFLFGLVSGLGFMLASLLIAAIRERLETADVPESFRNLPILILAAGLCAMTFTGFAGLSF